MAKRRRRQNNGRVDMHALIHRRRLMLPIAEACGIARQAVDQWHTVPSIRVLAVEKITGIPRHRIRPDLYPRP